MVDPQYVRWLRGRDDRRKRFEALRREVEGTTISDYFASVGTDIREADAYVRGVLLPSYPVPNAHVRRFSMLRPRSIAHLIPGTSKLDEERLEALSKGRVVNVGPGVPLLLADPIMIDPEGYVISGVHEGVVAVMRRAGLETVVVRSAREIGERSDRDTILDAIENKERYIDAACAHGITSIADLAARYAVPR
jgi:hypothetical protein